MKPHAILSSFSAILMSIALSSAVSCSSKKPSARPSAKESAAEEKETAWEKLQKSAAPVLDSNGKVQSVPGLTFDTELAASGITSSWRETNAAREIFSYTVPEGAEASYSLPLALEASCDTASYQASRPKVSDIGTLENFIVCIKLTSPNGETAYIRSQDFALSLSSENENPENPSTPDSSSDTEEATPPPALSAPLSLADGLKTEVKSETPTMTWTAPAELGTGIARYEIKLGTSSGGGDVLAFTSVGLVTSAKLTGLNLDWGKMYYPTIRAVDTAGQVSAERLGDGFRAGTIETSRLSQFLIYNGWPISINGCGTVNCAADEFKVYSTVVLGFAISDSPGNPTLRQNVSDIIDSVEAKHGMSGASTDFYGYITLDQTSTSESIAQIEARIDQWKSVGAKGIFVDMAGFYFLDDEADDAARRARQNAVIDYAHAEDLKVIMNASLPGDLFTSVPSDPIRLQSGDGYFFQGYLISENAAMPYDTDYRDKLAIARTAKANLGLKIHAISTSDAITSFPWTADRWNYLVGSAHMDGIDTIGYSVYNYSGSDNVAPYHAIPAAYESLSFVKEDLTEASTMTKITRRRVYTDAGVLRGLVSFDWDAKTSDILTVLP